ncbi:FHA domain-containing serine/threonine-protein kinase [Actinoallomurus soli]|uniref:FHA domain-containing serine/threonine-protein kinase n=1 Tax=Actinoallomurus soli TaxID=2952535 RepID=UPI00209337D8|nr:FHA domain-containing serine/threonine-protein kinase [Actinoallomurus soli]
MHTASFVAEYVFDQQATCLVGRSQECDIKISDHHRSVSRRHCRLTVDPPRLQVRDLGSSFGTHVNGHRLGRLTEWVLTDGDEVRIGDVRLRIGVIDTEDNVTAPGEEPTAPVTAPGYELLRELGRGSQGVVHLARHLDSGQVVALKRMWTFGRVDDNARFAFRREVEGIRALRHPHIVRFQEAGDEDDALYFATEYCAEGNLEQLAARHGGKIPRVDALAVVRQVLSALSHAHQAILPVSPQPDGENTHARGLVHRDVKPANILLAGTGPEGRPLVKLGDFGLAKAFERAGLSGHTRTGALGGTIPFAPRVQLVSYKYVGPEVDIWATAACLYWMLTGATPRDFPLGRDPVAIALREPVVRIRDRDPSVPPQLAKVIDEALTDTPRITVRTADELALALRDITL